MTDDVGGEVDADWWTQLLERYERLICGWINYRAVDDGEPVRGLVLAVTEAEDEDEFFEQASAAARAAGREVIAADRVRHVVGLADPGPEVFALAAEAIETGDAALGGGVEYPDKPAGVDPDETQVLEEAKTFGHPVYVVTFDGEFLGHIVGFSDQIVLAQDVDLGSVSLNGYAAFVREEVLKLRSLDDEVEGDAPHFLPRALAALGISPEDPHGPLDDLATLMGWLAGTYPLVGVYEDREIPGGFFAGAILSVTEASFVVRGINRQGLWTGEYEHLVADITRVDFDTGYLRALATVSRK